MATQCSGHGTLWFILFEAIDRPMRGHIFLHRPRRDGNFTQSATSPRHVRPDLSLVVVFVHVFITRFLSRNQQRSELKHEKQRQHCQQKEWPGEDELRPILTLGSAE